MEKKITVNEQFEQVKVVLLAQGETDLAEFIQGRIDLNKKKNNRRKDNGKSTENSILAEKLLAIFERDSIKMTLSEIANTYSGELGGITLSTQKLSAVLRPALADGTLAKDRVKGKMLYHLPSVSVEDETDAE
jgi:hypothetical protein